MRATARENALSVFVAATATAAMAWLGLYGFAWNDYDNEARPAFDALLHGHLADFLRLAPAYGGSLIERSPFALLASLWNGGALAVYRLVALPCLAAAAVLGVVLVARMRRQGHSRLARAVTLGICVANPLTLRALELGHPEELLGACLCVAAVLLAGGSSDEGQRPLWAGVLLGLAVANKPWALLAAGPVLLALAPERRLRCAVSAVAVTAAVLAPLLLVGSGGFVAASRSAATPAGTIFQPWQIWWFLGDHGATVHGLYGSMKPGYRIGPDWTSAIAHPLIVACALLAPIALWLRGRQLGLVRLSTRTALLALAQLALLRCVLDTWDAVYYALPFVFALLAWEVSGPDKRPPVLALVSTVLAWVSFQWLPDHVSPDAQAAFFLAWSLPLTALLGHLLLESQRAQSAGARDTSAPPGARQAMTVSSLVRPVSTS